MPSHLALQSLVLCAPNIQPVTAINGLDDWFCQVFTWTPWTVSLLQFLLEEQSKQRSGSVSLQRMLEDVFRLAITAAFPQLDNPPVLVTPSAKMADYQCNSAMSLAQVLQQENIENLFLLK